MALRRLLGCLSVVALLCTWAACEDEGKKMNAAKLGKRCEQLAKACGDSDKHAEKLVAECTQAAKKQVEKSCTDKAIAAYDCFERELCGKSDKVWALDDFRVLSDRHGKCAAERNALRECVGD